MAISIQRFFLLIIGLLFCVMGCTREHVDVTMLDDPSAPMETDDHSAPMETDDHSEPMETHEPVDVEVAFEQHLLPILTARCALSGCHVADGPHGLDFRTYESFIAGGEHGPAFIPGNAEDSEIVEQIVSGNMPPGGPPLTDAEIQLFINWINHQETQDAVVQHEHDAHGDQTGGNGHDAEDDISE